MNRVTRTAGSHLAGRSMLLDVLRGVAILLVLGCHYVVPPGNAGALSDLAGGWAHVGWAGVDLFFVLSGYLVSGLIFTEYARTHTFDLKRFAIRRAFKIWPPYAVYLVVVLVWLIYKSDLGAALSGLWPNFLHAQNYLGTPRVHTWSLAVEEHFYVVGALVFAWLFRRGLANASSLRIVGALVLAALTVSVSRYLAHVKSGSHYNLYATHLRCDGLIFGTLLAHFSHFRPHALAFLSARPLATLFLGAGLAAPVLILTPDKSAWTAGPGLTGLYIGFALMLHGLLATAHTPWMARGLRIAPVRLLGWVGFFSYGIYLWHVEFAQTPFKQLAASETLLTAGAAKWLLLTTGYVAAALIGGAIMSKLIELPALRLRDRLFPSKTRTAVPPPAWPIPVCTPPVELADSAPTSSTVGVDDSTHPFPADRATEVRWSPPPVSAISRDKDAASAENKPHGNAYASTHTNPLAPEPPETVVR